MLPLHYVPWQPAEKGVRLSPGTRFSSSIHCLPKGQPPFSTGCQLLFLARFAWGGVEPPRSPYQNDMLPLHHQAEIRVAVHIDIRDGRIRTDDSVVPGHVGYRSPTSRHFRIVGWKALESFSPGLQPGATPSQLPAQLVCQMSKFSRIQLQKIVAISTHEKDARCHIRDTGLLRACGRL